MNFEEIFVANGFAILMMAFLLDCRHRNRESIHSDDKVYDLMAIITILGAVLETLSFWIDGKMFFGARILNHLTNSLCFIGTVGISFLWCIYVDLHIYKNHTRFRRYLKYVILPFIIELVAVLYNLAGNGFLFTISADNVYRRSFFSVLGYITIYIYFVYSIYLVYHSKEEGMNVDFFPIFYFVAPSIIGVAVQYFHYGITTSWISVALSLTFVQTQAYSENISTDSLSGLFNRRYLDCVLAKKELLEKKSIYGILMDINDFKCINDHYGHNVGDQVIRLMGHILSNTVPENAIAIRYAGDEFVVLIIDEDPNTVVETMHDISKGIDVFNHSGIQPFTMSVSMGHAKLDPTDTEAFLREMDLRMYEEKRKYHAEKTE